MRYIDTEFIFFHILDIIQDILGGELFTNINIISGGPGRSLDRGWIGDGRVVNSEKSE